MMRSSDSQLYSRGPFTGPRLPPHQYRDHWLVRSGYWINGSYGPLGSNEREKGLVKM